MRAQHYILIIALWFVTNSAGAFSKKITIHAKIPCTVKSSTIQESEGSNMVIRLKLISNSDNDIWVTYNGDLKLIQLESYNEFESMIFSKKSDLNLKGNDLVDISIIP